MGSEFGKSIVEPTGTATTCGTKRFCFWMILTVRGAAPGEGAPTSSSHSTTPEEVLLRRTFWSRESTNCTVPVTVAAIACAASAALKHIRESEVIVVDEALPE